MVLIVCIFRYDFLPENDDKVRPGVLRRQSRIFDDGRFCIGFFELSKGVGFFAITIVDDGRQRLGSGVCLAQDL